MSKLIDGKALALKHEEVLKKKIKKLVKAPRFVIFSNYEDPSVDKFTQLKVEKATKLGIHVIVIYIVDHMKLDELRELIEKENEDLGTDGVMVQLPLPPSLQKNTDNILTLINAQKDVDGLTEKGPFSPATVKGVLSILESLKLKVKSKKFAVVGSKGFVGKPMVKVLKEKGVRVLEIDKKNPGSSLTDLKNADVVISCTGVNNLIRAEHIKKGAILIDVGLGDFEEKCFEKASAYTPKKGGVGPMTVISLMENVIESVERKN